MNELADKIALIGLAGKLAELERRIRELEQPKEAERLTDSTQELDEILCQAFYIEDGEYIGSYKEGSPIGFDIKQSLLDWHNKQTTEGWMPSRSGFNGYK